MKQQPDDKKGLTDKEFAEKYEAGKIDLGEILKETLKPKKNKPLATQ